MAPARLRSASNGRPTSLNPTCRTPEDNTSGRRAGASAIVRSSCVSMKMKSGAIVSSPDPKDDRTSEAPSQARGGSALRPWLAPHGIDRRPSRHGELARQLEAVAGVDRDVRLLAGLQV